MSRKQHMSPAALRLDELLARARMASAPKEVRKVVQRLKRKVDEASLSRYRHAKQVPSLPTAGIIETITKDLGDEFVVRASDWAVS